jgi:hypothetical protein
MNESFEKEGIADSMKSVERSAPKEIAPIVSFIDALLPPRTIRVTCHLQWRDKNPNESNRSFDKVGITFEVADSKEQEDFNFTQTLWWKSEIEDTQRKLTERYIELRFFVKPVRLPTRSMN